MVRKARHRHADMLLLSIGSKSYIMYAEGPLLSLTLTLSDPFERKNQGLASNWKMTAVVVELH